jgi:hypothetical protein
MLLEIMDEEAGALPKVAWVEVMQEHPATKDYIEEFSKGGKVEYETRRAKGGKKLHDELNNNYFAIHKPTRSIARSWEYEEENYDHADLMANKEDYFYYDIRDDHEGSVDELIMSDFAIVKREDLDWIGIDLDDYEVFLGQKYNKGGKAESRSPKTVSIKMGWEEAMRIYIMILQSGKQEGKRIARKELMELAKAVDENNEKARRKYWAIFQDNELEVIDDPAEFYDDPDLPSTPQLTIEEAIEEAKEEGYEVIGTGVGKTGNPNAIFVKQVHIVVPATWGWAMSIYIPTIEQKTKAMPDAIADLMELAKSLDESGTLEQ